MTFATLWLTLRRNWAFARHIPPQRMLGRLQMSFDRAMRDRGFSRRYGKPAPSVSPILPSPLFPPRSGLMRAADDGGLEFSFIGRTHRMARRIDWDAPGPGPALQLWRMNLHYMEYLEATDDALFIRLVTDWIAANPASRPGSWRDSWNPYALSLRIVVWMQQLALRKETLPEEKLPAILDSLAEQIRYLAGELETDIGGNHLVKNTKALIWASTFFAGSEAASWRKTGLALLTRVIETQVLACGMHFERSPSYHVQVLADLLECRHVLGAASVPTLDAALAAMAQVTADLAHPDGFVAQFNDSGLSMAYAPAVSLDAYKRIFGDCPLPRAAFALEPGGYYGLRSGKTYFVADCGRIAPDDLPAHGHGDVLSFEWSVAGKRIVVDPGVYEYDAGPCRQASRSAASHNTLCLAGADQAAFFGAFRLGRRPDVTVLLRELEADRLTLEGSHDGFRHLPGRPIHVRRFEVTPDAIVITDRIEGDTERAAHIGFLLHPDVQVAQKGGALWLTRDDTVVRIISTSEFEVRDAVWWPDMGWASPTKRVVIPVACGIRRVLTMLQVEAAMGPAIDEET